MVLALFDIVLVMLATFKVISLLPFKFVIVLFFAFDFGCQICVDGIMWILVILEVYKVKCMPMLNV